MRKLNFENFKKQKGITLVALIVTVVVLLILAGVTITYVFSDNGILSRAQTASTETDIKTAIEEIEQRLLAIQAANEGSYTNEDVITAVENVTGNLVNEFDSETKTKQGNKLDLSDYWIGWDAFIGGYVDYVPDESSYTVLATYSGYSTDLEIETETSTAWRVWSCDGETLTLISDDSLNYTVNLVGNQGFNNGVGILNDACFYLYSSQSLGATARSIKIEDIESVSSYDKTSYVSDTSYYR